MSNKRSPLQTVLWFVWPLGLIALLFLFRTLSGESNSAGARLYGIHCANCHMEAGQGLQALIPALDGSEYVQTHGVDMACLLRQGIPAGQNGTQPLRQAMPANPNLNERELAALINFLRNAWRNQSDEVLTVPQVEEFLTKNCPREEAEGSSRGK